MSEFESFQALPPAIYQPYKYPPSFYKNPAILEFTSLSINYKFTVYTCRWERLCPSSSHFNHILCDILVL